MKNVLLANPWFPLQAYIFRPKGRGITPKLLLKPMITQTDYALWLNNTVNLLKQKKYDNVDWENVIEEIEQLGRNQRRELRNRLTTLLEHCLKLYYSNYNLDYRGWSETIQRSQRELKELLEDAPSSLRRKLRYYY